MKWGGLIVVAMTIHSHRGYDTGELDIAAATEHGSAMTVKPAAKRKPNLAGRPTAAELERRKSRVMEVATDLFVRHGYAATSLIDVAREAGVATRTLYQHFGDKEALFRDVIFARDTGGFFQKPSVEDGDMLADVLRRTARYAIEVTYRERSINLMRLMIAESQRFPDLTRQVAMATFSRFRRSVASVFETLEHFDRIPAGDHAESASLFIDFLLGSTPIMAYAGWSGVPPTDAELDTKVDLFILGRFGPTVAASARETVT